MEIIAVVLQKQINYRLFNEMLELCRFYYLNQCKSAPSVSSVFYHGMERRPARPFRRVTLLSYDLKG